MAFKEILIFWFKVNVVYFEYYHFGYKKMVFICKEKTDSWCEINGKEVSFY